MLSPIYTSNNVEATGNDVETTFDFVAATFEFVAKNGNNVERVYLKISSFRQSRMLLRHCCRFWQQCCPFGQQCRTHVFREISSFRQSRVFNLFRLCRKDEISTLLPERNCCFDIVAAVDGALGHCK